MASAIISVTFLIIHIFACVYFIDGLIDASASGNLCETIKYATFTLIVFGNFFGGKD